MRRVPTGFYALAALGTALGAAAVTTVFSVAQATMPGSLPYRDPGSLVVVWDQLLKLDLPRFPLSTANYLDYRAHRDIFSELAAFQPAAVTLRLSDRSERANAIHATSELLPVLGLETATGRWFLPSEHPAQAVVLSHAFWVSRYGSDPHILSRTLSVNGIPHQVIGVLPADFQFRVTGEAPDLFLPLPIDPPADRLAGALRTIGRLRPGISVPAAQSALDALSSQLKGRYRTGIGPQGQDGGYRIWLTPLIAELYGPLRSTLQALAAAAVLLLFLGLINTALLWLGRAASRQREASIRLMLGASPVRVALGLAVESLAPTLLGGVLALGISAAALSVLNSAEPPELAGASPVSLHPAVLLAVVALCIAASVVFGLLPLRSLLRGPSHPRRSGRLHALLIGAQAALVCALLVPSLLLVRSLIELQAVNPGFATNGLLTASVTLPEVRYREPKDFTQYFTRLEAGLLERFPGRAALTSRLPLGLPEGGDPFSVEGRAYGASGGVPQVAHRLLASRHYLDLLQLRQLEGRGFEDRDFVGDTRSVVVNATLARAFFPGQTSLGKRILMGAPRPGAQWLTIVGVVADLHTARLDIAPIPQIFQPYWQAPARSMAVVAQGASSVELRQGLMAFDPEVPAYRLQSIQQHLATETAAPRLRTSIFSTYSALAFLLAAFGIYSLTAWSVARQFREFALRSALGATPAGLFRTILLRSVGPATAGALVGLAAAYAFAHLLAAHLYRASPSEPAPYVASVALAVLMAASASIPAARRALAANPADLLRTE